MKFKAVVAIVSVAVASMTLGANAAPPKYTVDESEVTINRQVEKRDTQKLFKGEEIVVQEGKDGKAIKTIVKGGKSPEVSLTVLEAPISRVIDVGVKIPTIDNLPKDWRPGGDGLTDDTKKVRAILFEKFPEIKEIGGYRECDFAGEHCSGRALDIMLEGQLGYDVMAYLEGLHKENVVKLCWNIYEQKIFYADKGFAFDNMEDRGSITQNHYDHVHAFLADSDGQCSKGK